MACSSTTSSISSKLLVMPSDGDSDSSSADENQIAASSATSSSDVSFAPFSAVRKAPTHKDDIAYKAPFLDSLTQAVNCCAKRIFSLSKQDQTYLARYSFPDDCHVMIHAQYVKGPIVGETPFRCEKQEKFKDVRLYIVEVDGPHKDSGKKGAFETKLSVVKLFGKKLGKSLHNELGSWSWGKSPNNKVVALFCDGMSYTVMRNSMFGFSLTSLSHYQGPSFDGNPARRQLEARRKAGLITDDEVGARLKQLQEEQKIEWIPKEITEKFESKKIKRSTFQRRWDRERAKIRNRVEDLPQDSKLRQAGEEYQKGILEDFKARKISGEQLMMRWQRVEEWALEQFRGPPWNCIGNGF